MIDVNAMEETNQCDKCLHKDVCQFKNELADATEQLKHTDIRVTDIFGKNRLIKLHDIPYIRPIKLICKHCMILPANTLLRKTD